MISHDKVIVSWVIFFRDSKFRTVLHSKIEVGIRDQNRDKRSFFMINITTGKYWLYFWQTQF